VLRPGLEGALAVATTRFFVATRQGTTEAETATRERGAALREREVGVTEALAQ